MRRLPSIVVLFCFLVLFVNGLSALGAIIWQDGFESGDFSAWSEVTGRWSVISSSQAAHTGSRGGDIIGSNNFLTGDILELRFSTVGYNYLALEYWYRVRENLETGPIGDFLFVEWSTNEIDWRNHATYTGLAADTWKFSSGPLPSAACNNPGFVLRLRALFSGTSDRMAFDDFVLIGDALPEPATLILFVPAILIVRPRCRC